jgi:hypothetical protein
MQIYTLVVLRNNIYQHPCTVLTSASCRNKWAVGVTIDPTRLDSIIKFSDFYNDLHEKS